jgi:hypothetical protein
MKNLFFKRNATVPDVPQKLPPLVLCLLMDFLGYTSFTVPFLGEFLDLLWAPVSAFIFYRMFGGTKGIFGGIFNFVEEILPGTDFIPTFTITWLLQYFRRNKGAYTIRPVNQ